MSERKKAYRAKKPGAAGRRGSEAVTCRKVSDEIITVMVKSLEEIFSKASIAHAEYMTALEYSNDEAVKVYRMQLYDRAIRRAVLAQHAFNRAYARQPEDFRRIIAESMK